MKISRSLCVLLLSLAAAGPVAGQYYNQGQDPSSTRWRQIATDRYRILYPEGGEADARRVGAVIDTAYGAIGYGLSLPGRRLPIVLHGQNLHSNGLVTWAPRRSELVLTPPTDTYAVPWLKQLSLHEYRHVVQMSNLDRHWLHALRIAGGEQVIGAAAAFLPGWYLEGDAVLAETAMSAFGRARQPEFTLVYRALLDDEGVDRFPVDKWLVGSLREPIPNHYNLGYQLVDWSYRHHGPEFWERVYDYTTRRPYLVLPRQIAMRRFYGTSTRRLLGEAFTELKRHWDSMPDVEDSAVPVGTPFTAYTTYSHPVPIDSARTVALKTDLDRPERLVLVDTRTGAERVLAYTGPVSSRPVAAGGELLWTEYRPDAVWEQRSRSVILRMPLDGSRRARATAHPEGREWFFVTPYRAGFAAVSYDLKGKYAVELLDADLRPVRRLPIADTLTVHGLAWDPATETLALITLGESGMALTELDPATGALSRITEPSYVTLGHLRAGEGRLFFHSIHSGRDEAHTFDLASGREARITTSRYGSTMPAPVPGTGRVVLATYRRQGWFLSTQALDADAAGEVSYRRLPHDVLNPAPCDWRLPVLDTMRLLDTAALPARPSRRYRKAAHLIGVHSWMPVGLDAFEAIDERNLDLKFGATVLSQNTLSNTEAYLSYGIAEGRNWWKGGLRLRVLAPTVELSVEYDGGDQLLYAPAGTDPARLPPLPGPLERFLALDGRVSLPLDLSSGRMLRSLTPSVRLTHYNTLFYRPHTNDYGRGYAKGEASLSYAQNVRTVARDLAPRRGFGVQASWSGAPGRGDFGRVWSLYGNLYLPGLAPHHSLRLRGVGQYQEASTYNFTNNVLFPRGALYNFAPRRLGVVLADYRLPLAYPDGGIPGLIYIKRVSADLFGGWARYRPLGAPSSREAWSAGAEIALDTHPLSSRTGVQLRLALYKVGGEKGLSAGFGMAIAL